MAAKAKTTEITKTKNKTNKTEKEAKQNETKVLVTNETERPKNFFPSIETH